MTTVLSEERVLLSRALAREVLLSHNRAVERIVRVCDDGAVLYRAPANRNWTAWLHYTQDALSAVSYEYGWAAYPGQCARVSDEFPVDFGKIAAKLEADRCAPAG